MAERFDDGGTYLAEFMESVDVRCPSCGGRALSLARTDEATARVVCHGCGYSTSDASNWLGPIEGSVRRRCPRCGRWIERQFARGSHDPAHAACGCGWEFDEPITWHKLTTGALDPWFGLELWFQAPFRSEVLWAYNEGHLSYLRDFVAASVRSRTPDRNSTLASRLPEWIKSAKNREALLAVIAKLEAS